MPGLCMCRSVSAVGRAVFVVSAPACLGCSGFLSLCFHSSFFKVYPPEIKIGDQGYTADFYFLQGVGILLRIYD